jgi:hypothetical protein
MGGGARNHGGTRGHGCPPLPGERANYNLHTLSDNKLLKIINCSEKVKEKQPTNQKLKLLKVLPQFKEEVALERVPKKVLVGEHQKSDQKYKQTPSTKVSTRSPKVDNKKTEAKEAQAGSVRKLKSENTVQSEIDEAAKKLLPKKVEHKEVRGLDWKHGVGPDLAAVEHVPVEQSFDAINAATIAQGDLVKKQMPEKAAQQEIDKAVNKLPVPAAVEAGPTGGSTEATNATTTDQGDQVRKVVFEKVEQPEIDVAVKKLLPLKSEYKSITGSDCKPGVATAPAAVEVVPAEESSEAINAATIAQDDLVKKLNSEKPAQQDIDENIKKLLPLKAVTRSDWKPEEAHAPSHDELLSAEETAEATNATIASQGELVRKMLFEAEQPWIDADVNKLPLLNDDKYDTQSDLKPEASPAPAAMEAVPAGESAKAINAATTAQVDLVRELESERAVQAEIGGAVKKLLPLKYDYRAVKGSDWQFGEAHEPAAVAAAAGAINVASSEQNVLEIKPKCEKVHTELDEKAVIGLDLNHEAIVEPVSARASSKANNCTTTANGDIVMGLKCENAARTEIDESVRNLLNPTTEFKEVEGSNWKPAVAPGTSAAETVPTRGSAEAIITANTAQGDHVRRQKPEMSDLNDCRSSNSLGNLQDNHISQHLLTDQIPAPTLYIQQFFSCHESVSSFHLPVSFILHQPYYGYRCTPVFLNNTFIFMEDQVSLQQSSEASMIHGYPQD